MCSESSSDDDNDNMGLNNNTSSQQSRPETKTIIDEAHVSFWDCYKEIASTSTSKIFRPNSKNMIAVELDAYLSGEIVNKDHCPFSWWKKYWKKFPKMSQLAKVYLSAPASTVYSERLFSEAGNIYENKRNRLLPDTAESLVFLHHNLPLIDYEY